MIKGSRPGDQDRAKNDHRLIYSKKESSVGIKNELEMISGDREWTKNDQSMSEQGKSEKFVTENRESVIRGDRKQD